MTAHAGDVIGEIGVLCYMPQPFTVRSRKLSQLLRLDRIVFMNIVQSFKEDGQRIVDNLLQVSTDLLTNVDNLCSLAFKSGVGLQCMLLPQFS